MSGHPRIEPVDKQILLSRIQVQDRRFEDRQTVMLGGHYLVCTLDEWRAINAVVEDGFAALKPRPVPATKRKEKVL